MRVPRKIIGEPTERPSAYWWPQAASMAWVIPVTSPVSDRAPRQTSKWQSWVAALGDLKAGAEKVTGPNVGFAGAANAGRGTFIRAVPLQPSRKWMTTRSL